MGVIKLKKSFISCIFLAAILISTNTFASTKLFYDGAEHQYTAEDIKLMVDGQILESEIGPVIINSRTLVPVRAVFEKLGANMSWIEDTQEIIISFEDKLILLKIDSDTANVNGEAKTMEVAPKIINGSAMIPLRFVAESMNFDIGWNGNERIAFINSKSENESESSEIETETSTETIELESTESETETTETVESESEPKSSESATDIPDEQSTEIISEQSSKTESQSSETTSTDTQDTQNSTEATVEIETEQSTSSTENQTQQNKDISNKVVFESENNVTDETHAAIQNENHDVVNLIDIKMNGDTFEINADNKISSIQYDLIQEPTRFYIDIENSISKLSEQIDVTGSNIVKSIRTSQQVGFENLTRIVFDLNNVQNYDIYMSDDRNTIYIKFKPNTVHKVSFEKMDGYDSIDIYSNSMFDANTMILSDPDRLVIDLPNTVSNIGNSSANVDGNFISAIRTSQFDESTVRIVLDIQKLIDYEIVQNEAYTTFKIINPTYKNIEYKNSNDSPKLILHKNKDMNIDISAISHDDRYLENYYKLILKGDYSNIYGYGQYRINDGYLNSIDIQTNDGNTEFIFNEKNVYSVKITEDENNIYIYIYNPKSIYKHVVVIDPGHGGNASGAVRNGLVEKEVTLDVANRLYLLLDADENIKVYSTHVTDSNPSFDYRVDLPNHVADMFVSIHCNSIESSSVSGVQVFYPNPSDERGSISKQLAAYLMDGVTSNTGFPNRPANQAMGYQFFVLRNTTVPACLVEMGFLTNPSDAAKLATAEGRQQVAQGIYEGIKKGFETIIPER